MPSSSGLNPQPYEIYYCDKYLGKAKYERPYLVVDVRPDNVFGCYPISESDYDFKKVFQLDESHADFSETNLSKSCNILRDYIVEIHIDDFLRYKGKLTGRLLETFKVFQEFDFS